MTIDAYLPDAVALESSHDIGERSGIDRRRSLTRRGVRSGLALSFGTLVLGTFAGMAAEASAEPTPASGDAPVWGSALEELGHILQANVTVAVIAMVAGWLTVGIGTGPVMFGSLGMAGIGLGANLWVDPGTTMLIGSPHLVLEVVGLGLCAASGLTPFIASRHGFNVRSTARVAARLAGAGMAVVLIAAVIEATATRSLAISLLGAS